jgi:hypothetical protein
VPLDEAHYSVLRVYQALPCLYNVGGTCSCRVYGLLFCNIPISACDLPVEDNDVVRAVTVTLYSPVCVSGF